MHIFPQQAIVIKAEGKMQSGGQRSRMSARQMCLHSVFVLGQQRSAGVHWTPRRAGHRPRARAVAICLEDLALLRLGRLWKDVETQLSEHFASMCSQLAGRCMTRWSVSATLHLESCCPYMAFLFVRASCPPNFPGSCDVSVPGQLDSAVVSAAAMG